MLRKRTIDIGVKQALKILLAVLALSLARCTSGSLQTSTPGNQAVAPSPRGDFQKKEVCAAKLETLRNAAENVAYLEVYYRTFYSPRRDSCIAEKYTLYLARGVVEESESLQVLDLSANETLWDYRVPCEVKPTGNPDTPVIKRSCSDYAWKVEAMLDDYVKQNHLEGTQ